MSEMSYEPVSTLLHAVASILLVFPLGFLTLLGVLAVGAVIGWFLDALPERSDSVPWRARPLRICDGEMEVYDAEYRIDGDVLEVRYVLANWRGGQHRYRNRLLLAFQRGVGLDRCDDGTWVTLLRGARVTMVERFRLRDADDGFRLERNEKEWASGE